RPRPAWCKPTKGAAAIRNRASRRERILQNSGAELLRELAAPVQGVELVAAPDGLAFDEDLRHRAAAGRFHEPGALFVVPGDVDLLEGDAPFFEQGLRASAVRAVVCGVDLDL